MATEETGMRTYQIEITDSTKTPVKRFFFDSDKTTAYDMFNEWGARYDSTHKLELSNKQTGRLLPEGRMSGFKEFM